MTATKISVYGPKITTKSYILEMKDDSFFDPVIKLPGVSLGAPEPEVEDAVMIETFTLEGGFVRQRGHYARKAFNKAYTLEVGLVPGHATYWNPVKVVANSRGLCKRTFYATYLCPEDRRYGHFLSFDDALLDEIVQTNAIIATTDAEEGVTATTTMRIPSYKYYYALAVTERMTDASGDPLYAVAFRLRHCLNCPLDLHNYGTYGGGDGTAVPVIQSTSDGFASSSAVTNSLAAGLIQTDVYTNGDIVIRTFADENVTAGATATAGAVLVSSDGGTTVTAVSGITVPVYFVTYANGQYWIGGEDGLVFTLGQDLSTVTAITNPLAASGLIYTDAAYDQSTGYLYLVGYSTTNSRVHRVEGTAFTDLSSVVNAGANILYRVEVLGPDHIIIGGASGTLRESANASTTSQFNTVYSGTTDDVRGLCGDLNRCLFFAGTGVFSRSRLEDDVFKELPAVAGTTISGNFTAAAIGELWDGANYFVGVTDASEVVLVKPYLPE